MKNFVLIYCFICFVSLVFADNFRENFQNPPDLACAETWYHFTTEMITKEGITADMEAMRDIGYKGAHVFATGGNVQNSVFKNPVAIMSPQWQEMMEHLGREAKRCGIKLGMHNCPGWSSSGGPWIKPEDSMKKLTASEYYTKGGNINVQLPQPDSVRGYYRDFIVLAIPAKEKMPTPKVSSNLSGGENLLQTRTLVIPTSKHQGGTVYYKFDKPYSAKFAKFIFNPVHVYINIEVSVSNDAKNYQKVAYLPIDSFKDKSVPKFLYLGKDVKAKFYKFDFIPRKFPSFFKKARDISLNSILLIQESIIDSVNKKISLVADYQYVEPKVNTKGIPLNEIINITDKMAKDGTISATLPKGNWKILRIGYTITGATNAPTTHSGLECDKLSKRGLYAHWGHYVGEMQKWFAGALKYATIDSYEVGGQNWTEDFDAEFKKRRGYDITKYLPCVFGYVVENEKQSSKFLFDLQRTVSELFCENYYDYFHQLCKKNGLTSIVEPYGGPFDFMRASRNYDFVLSEFWVRDVAPEKSISSVANLYGKKRAGAESFTSSYENGRWGVDPAELKIYGDIAWGMGVNAFVMHTYVHQPFNAGPGFTLGRHGSDLHRLNTWWKMGDAWVGYINKAQTLLQAGIAIKQILFVPPITAPNSNWKSKLNKSIVDEGFDYDICSVEDLGDILYVDNGKIRASKNGVSYNLLVVEGNNLNTIAKIKAIENLVADGANVLAERPVDSPSLSDNKGEFDELVERIWGGNEAIKKIGKGKLFKNGSPLSILRNMGVKPKCLAKNMLTICRTTGSHDIFYIVNTTKNSFNKNIFFNVENGKIPQLWDAYTGKIENITEYKRSNNEVEIPLCFSENDSKFIVFVEGKEQSTTSVATSEKQNTKTCIEALDISNDWNVYFQKNRGAPDSIKLAKTQSLSQSQIDGVKYFSGTMLYEKEIEIPSDYIKENRKLILEFDKIYNIAQVEINGKFVQTLWKSPYRCDITKHLKVGKNIIKIKVANLWVNRIIGDSQYPYEPLQNWVIQGKTKSESKRITSSDWSSAWGKKDKLLESGIVGKVQIKACDVVPIKNN